jgi:hypothetical protein
MTPTWLLSQGNLSLSDSGGKFRLRLTPAAGLPNTEVITWANAQTAVDHYGGSVWVSPNSQKSYGFLPWRPGGATYVEIPNNVGAQLVLTGPLSACNVWAFDTGASTVLVHANKNSGMDWDQMSAAQQDTNMTDKMNLINAIKNQYPGSADVARLVYANTPGVVGAFQYDGYQGWVLGCKPRAGFSLNKVSWTGQRTAAAAWTFYFYGYSLGGAAVGGGGARLGTVGAPILKPIP